MRNRFALPVTVIGFVLLLTLGILDRSWFRSRAKDGTSLRHDEGAASVQVQSTAPAAQLPGVINEHDANDPLIVGPWLQTQYAANLAIDLAQRITEHLSAYHREHGRFPRAKRFWADLGTTPIHNPFNGSAIVAASVADQRHEFGWTYNEEAGLVLANVGNGPNSAPTTQTAPAEAEKDDIHL